MAPDSAFSGSVALHGIARPRSPAPTLGRGGFWLTFSAGWVAYAALLGGPAYLEGESVLPGFVMTIPPASLGVLLALRRRDLANPDRPLARTAALLLGVGVLYALGSALLTLLLVELLGPERLGMGSTAPVRTAMSFIFMGFILYAIQAGFLLWSESLERIQESRTLAAREAVLRAEAEAKALRAQFNPHFVFNTLHSLMLLVREDPGRAEKAIEDVASLIRYASSLERRGEDTVSLSRELEMARRYLALEALRLEDRLRVVWEVDDELTGIAIPAFCLQTLLENAIKHGLSPNPEGGRIQVVVSRKNGGMLLRVEDDGMGADPGSVARTEGSGLRLLARRLAVLYGDGASMTWRTAPGEGFRVVLRWPAAPAVLPGGPEESAPRGARPLQDAAG